jgi:uncharacterized protein YodC (DUF2158 family)
VANEDFKLGDVVKLKSGGPLMTVISTDVDASGAKAVLCSWFHEGKPLTNYFPTAAVTAARGIDEAQA